MTVKAPWPSSVPPMETLTLASKGSAAIDREPVALSAVVADAWRHVDTGSLTLRDETTQTIFAHRERLLDVFENLFRNAVEHAGEGVEVRVGDLPPKSGESDGTDGFFVEDDGCGIPASDREMVFEIGFTTAASGSGFGLRIVQEVVDGHDWTVRLVDSSTGGARFEFTQTAVDSSLDS